MKNALILAGILAAALMAGCSSDNGGSTSTSGSSGGSTTGQSTTGSSSSTSGSTGTGSTGGSSTSGSSGSTGIPTPPTLGSQIDRMGRPAVNTAVTDPFDLDATNEGNLKDQYNSDATPSDWATNWTSHFATNLAILDALDNVCGNQAFASFPDGGVNPNADRYATLATVLSNDRLWLNTAPVPAGTCTTYLAVEAAATGFVPNDDCGGRAPTYDVIDESYSVLAAGAISGVSDGVDQSGHNAVSNTTFPFLGDPK